MQTKPVPNYEYEREQIVETEFGKPIPIDPVRNRFQCEHPNRLRNVVYKIYGVSVVLHWQALFVCGRVCVWCVLYVDL